MSNIQISKELLKTFCQKQGISRLSLFGSVLRDDFGVDSDIDVLVEFEPSVVVGFFKLYDLEVELSQLFGWLKVQILTYQDLSPYFRDEILNQAETYYVHA